MNRTDHRATRGSTRRVMTYIAVGLVVPAVAVLASVAAQLIAWPELPDQIAVHWNAAGDPDRWGSPWVLLVLTVVVGLGVPLIAVVPNLAPLRAGARGPSFRTVAAVTAAASSGVSALFAATVVPQTDGQDMSAAAPIGIMLAVAAVVGVVGWLVIPRDLSRESGAVEPLSVAPGERVAWIGTESLTRWLVICIVAVLALSAFFIVTAGLGGTSGGLVPAVIVAVTLVALIATTVAFHVTVDADGLRVRSILGFPRFHIPADDIDHVDVIDVRAIGDFGGYGIRHRRGALGVILRSGPAVEITRRSTGRRFIVTVDDAGTAAATVARVAVDQR